MGDPYIALAEKLGVAGALFAVCVLLLHRYDKLAKVSVDRVKEANVARVAEATQQAKMLESMLPLITKMVSDLAALTSAVQLTTQSVESAAKAMERSAQSLEAAAASLTTVNAKGRGSK